MRTVVLRRMTSADVPALACLEQAVFGDEAWSADMLTDELAGRAGNRYYLVAEADAEILGYGGLVLLGGDQADVGTLAVAAAHWGQGIGAALLTGLLAEAERQGCTEVFLEVRVDNDRAQRLYRRHGFEDVGLRRGYYQPSGADALVMRRTSGRSQAVPATAQ
ncbi:MAG TPA: ribosomal protein S18-alanine N-acetyltransferase [Streptosporangiaceae bacterium]|nr:ribosomal protein S18-alanine N-acetyltransferase [Streptosporangiaceae bacterium]